MCCLGSRDPSPCGWQKQKGALKLPQALGMSRWAPRMEASRNRALPSSIPPPPQSFSLPSPPLVCAPSGNQSEVSAGWRLLITRCFVSVCSLLLLPLSERPLARFFGFFFFWCDVWLCDPSPPPRQSGFAPSCPAPGEPSGCDLQLVTNPEVTNGAPLCSSPLQWSSLDPRIAPGPITYVEMTHRQPARRAQP